MQVISSFINVHNVCFTIAFYFILASTAVVPIASIHLDHSEHSLQPGILTPTRDLSVRPPFGYLKQHIRRFGLIFLLRCVLRGLLNDRKRIKLHRKLSSFSNVSDGQLSLSGGNVRDINICSHCPARATMQRQKLSFSVNHIAGI